MATAEERSAIDAQMTALTQLARDEKDHLKLKDAILKLDELSKPFVERVVNRAIGGALEGHSVEEY